MLFNPPQHSVHVMAKQLLKEFEGSVGEMLAELSGDPTSMTDTFRVRTSSQSLRPRISEIEPASPDIENINGMLRKYPLFDKSTVSLSTQNKGDGSGGKSLRSGIKPAGIVGGRQGLVAAHSSDTSTVCITPRERAVPKAGVTQSHGPLNLVPLQSTVGQPSQYTELAESSGRQVSESQISSTVSALGITATTHTSFTTVESLSAVIHKNTGSAAHPVPESAKTHLPPLASSFIPTFAGEPADPSTTSDASFRTYQCRTSKPSPNLGTDDFEDAGCGIDIERTDEFSEVTELPLVVGADISNSGTGCQTGGRRSELSRSSSIDIRCADDDDELEAGQSPRFGRISRLDSVDSVSEGMNAHMLWNSRSIYDTGTVGRSSASSLQAQTSQEEVITVSWEKPQLGFRGSLSMMSDLSKSVMRLKDDLFVIKFGELKLLRTKSMLSNGTVKEEEVGVTRNEVKRAKVEMELQRLRSQEKDLTEEPRMERGLLSDPGSCRDPLSDPVTDQGGNFEVRLDAIHTVTVDHDDSSSSVVTDALDDGSQCSSVMETSSRSSNIQPQALLTTAHRSHKRGRPSVETETAIRSCVSETPRSAARSSASAQSTRGRRKGSSVLSASSRGPSTSRLGQVGRPPKNTSTDSCSLASDDMYALGGAYISDECMSMLAALKPDTSDPDGFVTHKLVDSRHTFLEMCQFKHLQFDSLRRAKHSSMMLLYYLHNQDCSSLVPVCSCCGGQLRDVRWHCDLCPNLDFCASCYDSGYTDEGGAQCKNHTSTSISNIHEHLLTPFRVTFS
jgi:hypothetical protein